MERRQITQRDRSFGAGQRQRMAHDLFAAGRVSDVGICVHGIKRHLGHAGVRPLDPPADLRADGLGRVRFTDQVVRPVLGHREPIGPVQVEGRGQRQARRALLRVVAHASEVAQCDAVVARLVFREEAQHRAERLVRRTFGDPRQGLLEDRHRILHVVEHLQREHRQLRTAEGAPEQPSGGCRLERAVPLEARVREETVEGIEIFRVDERKEASKDAYFDETEVRKSMTYEVIPAERKKYLVSLRGESYIKVNDTYRPLVSPILSAETKPEEKKPTK